MKKSLAILLCILFIATFILPASALASVPVKGVSLDAAKVNLEIGQTYKLKITLSPVNTTQRMLTFSTANKNVAAIDKTGQITAVGPGMTTITVYTSNKSISAKCNVTVAKPKPATVLNMVFPVFRDIPKDLKTVESEINKITLKKANVKVNITAYSFGAWNQQFNLMLASGEKLDVLPVGAEQFAGCVAKSQIITLDDLAAKYAQGAKDAIGAKYLSAGKVNGKLYGLPPVKDFAAGIALFMKKDMAAKYKVNTTKKATLDEIGTLFKAVKAGEPNMNVLVPGNATTSFVDFLSGTDVLTDGFGQLVNKGQRLVVVNYYNTQEYANLVNTMRAWYQAGYIYKDSATNKDAGASYLKANKGVFYLGRTKPGIENQETNSVGSPMVYIPLIDAFSTTAKVQTVMWSIPQACKTPDQAMQFINLMFTDTGIINLLDWGVEGQHYVKNAEGTIEYPQGVDSKTSRYNLNMGWLFGNQLLSYIWKGDSVDLWSQMTAFNANAFKSKALGFTFDSSNVKTEIAALNSVTGQYKMGLETGTLDPESYLPEFRSKLIEAGITKVVAEKQKQMDTWAKTNK